MSHHTEDSTSTMRLLRPPFPSRDALLEAPGMATGTWSLQPSSSTTHTPLVSPRNETPPQYTEAAPYSLFST